MPDQPAAPEFFEVVLSQRAARHFLTDDLEDETIARILTAATHAPSVENTQPYAFIVVHDPETHGRIGEMSARLWQGGARAIEEDRLSPAMLRDVHEGAMGGIAAAPVLVVVCGDTRLAFPQTIPSSVFPAVQNLLLAADALGLGSTLTTLTALAGDELAALLGLPPEVVPVAVVPLGRIAAPLGPPRRRPLAETAHLDRYGSPFPAANASKNPQ